MIRNCIECDQPTIVGRYVDNHLIVMDGKPAANGTAVLKGDLNDEPTVVFGIETEEDDEFWHVPLDADRYERHACKADD